jgi:hypothetical protein
MKHYRQTAVQVVAARKDRLGVFRSREKTGVGFVRRARDSVTAHPARFVLQRSNRCGGQEQRQQERKGTHLATMLDAQYEQQRRQQAIFTAAWSAATAAAAAVVAASPVVVTVPLPPPPPPLSPTLFLLHSISERTRVPVSHLLALPPPILAQSLARIRQRDESLVTEQLLRLSSDAPTVAVAASPS